MCQKSSSAAAAEGKACDAAGKNPFLGRCCYESGPINTSGAHARIDRPPTSIIFGYAARTKQSPAESELSISCE